MKKIILLLMFIVPMNALAQKFGHIRSMEIIASMPEYVKAQADIQTLKKQYDDEMNRTQNDLTKKFTEYQQEQANLPKNIQERRQKELQDLNEKGIQFQQDAKKLLEKAYQDMLQPIRKKMDEAINMINIITTDFEKGQKFTGKVVSIKEFGAFVEFAPGKEGMVHISKIANERIEHVEDVLTLGDTVTVVCLGKDKMGRISFSMKDVEA